MANYQKSCYGNVTDRVPTQRSTQSPQNSLNRYVFCVFSELCVDRRDSRLVPFSVASHGPAAGRRQE
jgi:hypothetical protein